MARIGTPLLKISIGARGLPGSGTDAGPPDRITAFGFSRANASRRLRERVDLAIDASLPHAPGDQLRHLRAEVDDEDEVVAHAPDVAEEAGECNPASRQARACRRGGAYGPAAVP